MSTVKISINPDSTAALEELGRRYGLSYESVQAMLLAVHAGGGTMAQFSIPEFGGSGQWMRGGMTMVGNMFDNALKARVDALCSELAGMLASTAVVSVTQAEGGGVLDSGHWWPAELGVPSSVGGQNESRYAVFPSVHQLAIQINGVTRIYDTDDHRISGVQQQQGTGYDSLTFTSQHGTFSVSGLRERTAKSDAPASRTPPIEPETVSNPDTSPRQQSTVSASAARHDDPAAIIAKIEALAGLHERGILTDDEYAKKKAELLGRL